MISSQFLCKYRFPNHTVGAIIVRALTAAFDAGLLPADNDITLNKDYFKSKHDDFYTNNAHLDNKGGPWFDLYSKEVHNFKGQPIYTFAYDDALGQDGTLYSPDADNIGKVSVTIGDMTGTTIPDPYTDDTKYMLTVNLGQNQLNAFYELKYGEQSIKPGAPTILKDVTSPFVVTFNGIEESIYIKYPMVVPYNPIAEGIVIDVNKVNPSSVTINFPGPPKDVTPEELTQDAPQHDEL